MNKTLFFWIIIFINIALATGGEALSDVEARVAVVRSDAKAVPLSNPVEESIPAKGTSTTSQPQPETDEWERLAAMSSKAGLIAVAENPWQYDRLYAKQVLKGSKVIPISRKKHATRKQPSTMQANDPRRGARVELVLDKQEYFLGENILLHYCVSNQGAEPFRVDAGGDYRGAPRHLRFKVVATDAEGKLVEDPYPSIMCMGGLSSGKMLQPGGTWWQSLPLMRYCDFHQPGVYKLKVYHDLGWEGFDYWNNIEANVLPQGPHIAPVVETTIKLVMPSKKEAQQVVKHMLTLPRNPNARVGERHREYEDFAAARYPVYLSIVSKLAKRGYEHGLDAIGAMATPEATWMLIQLLGSKHDNISSKAMKLLLKRLPEPKVDKRRWDWANRLRLVGRSWHADMKPAVLNWGWKSLAKNDRKNLMNGAYIIRCLGGKDDFHRFMKILDRGLVAMKDDPVEQHSYPRPPTASAALVDAGWELVERGAKVPTDTQTPGQAILFMLALSERENFRPSNWEITAAELLKHPIPYVRAIAVKNLPVPLHMSLHEPVLALIKDDYSPVQVQACNLAAKTESERLRTPLLDILEETEDRWVLRAAYNAAFECGVNRDHLLEICVERLADNDLAITLFDLIIKVVEREGGHGYSQVDWSKVSELKARWKLLIENNRDRIRAGQLFKIAEPPLTPDLFPRGFRFQRKNKTSWPEWPKDITTRKSRGERHEASTRRHYYPELGYVAYDPYVYAGFDEFLWHPGSGDYKVLWKKTFEFNVDESNEPIKFDENTVTSSDNISGADSVSIAGDAAGLKVLIDTSNDERQPWYNRRHAIQALGKLRDKRAVPYLITALKDDHSAVRVSAVQALGAIGGIPVLIEQLKNEDMDVVVAAVKTLGEIGPEAEATIPAIIQAMRDGNWNIRSAAANVLAGIGPRAVPALIKVLGDEKEQAQVRSFAARALGQIGPPAQEAVPVLIQMFGDKAGKVRKAAAQALVKIDPEGKEIIPTFESARRADNRLIIESTFSALIGIGPKAVPTLVKALKDNEWYVRKRAAYALGKIRPPADEVFAALIESLKDEKSSVRGQAAGTLSMIRPVEPQVIGALIRTLEDKETYVWYSAGRALGNIGPEAKAAVPAFLEKLKDEDESYRCWAARALGKIGPAEEVVPVLIEAMKDESTEVRFCITNTLTEIGGEAVPALIEALKHENENVRNSAHRALRDFGPVVEDAVPALIKMLNDEKKEVRTNATDAVSVIGRAAKDAVPTLIEMLKDKDDDIRVKAALALGRIGPAAKEAFPELLPALKDENKQVRGSAVWALYQIGSTKPEVVDGLIQMLKDERRWVRSNALFALGNIGSPVKKAVPLIIEALKDDSNEVRKSAAVALHRIGPATKEVVPALIEALKDEDWSVHESSIQALGSMGPAAGEAVMALSQELKQEDRGIRCSAVQALSKIGPAAKAAVPALISALKDENEIVRYRAAEALGAIGPDAKEAVPALIQTLKSDSLQPRIDAAIALSKIGPGAYEAIPALIQRLKDKEWAVQSCAAWALQKITGEKFPRRDYTRWKNWWLENKNRKKKAFGNAKSQQK